MKTLIKKINGKKLMKHWDYQTPLERLNFIMGHSNLFCALRLINLHEVQLVKHLSEASREYIVEREEQPFFKNLHLKKEAKEQINSHKLRMALKMILFPPKKTHSIKDSNDLRPLAFG